MFGTSKQFFDDRSLIGYVFNFQPISAEGAKNRNPSISFNWLLVFFFAKEIVDFDTHYCEL